MTFNLQYDFNIQCVHSIITVHAHVQKLGLPYEGNMFFIIEGSFNLCQLFENQVVKVSKIGWHSLKYCVNMHDLL